MSSVGIGRSSRHSDAGHSSGAISTRGSKATASNKVKAVPPPPPVSAVVSQQMEWKRRVRSEYYSILHHKRTRRTEEAKVAWTQNRLATNGKETQLS